jgi:branched-chain amino acid transport system permease protein
MAFFVFHDTSLGGGSDGIYLYVPPGLGPLDLKNHAVLYYFVLALLAASYMVLALIRRSRFGATLAGIRVNEQRMRASGFPVYAYQLGAFVLGGAIAGMAGFLIASRDGAVNPELLAWHNSGEVLLMLILGGIGHLRGAVIGAVAFTLLKELLSAHAIVGSLADHWQLTLGLIIIAFVVLLPKGIIDIARRISPRGET